MSGRSGSAMFLPKWSQLFLLLTIVTVTVLGAPQKKTPEEFIVGGSTATRKSWPWQAELLYLGEFICGGTIVHSDIVLTAAHCVKDRNIEGLTVILGDYHRQALEGTEQFMRVAEVIWHPDYEAYLNGNDIALIRLNGSATYTSYVQPVPSLADEAVTQQLDPKTTTCYITGWGVITGNTKSTETSTTLQEAQIAVISKEKCNSKRFWNGRIKTGQLCAFYKKSSACDGDSGGPLVCMINNQYVLTGVTSWGSTACKSYPTVFTRLATFRDWIMINIGGV